MTVDPLTKAAEYRLRAQRTRETAEWFLFEDVRHQLFEAARHLEALAEQEERRARKMASRPDPEPDA